MLLLQQNSSEAQKINVISDLYKDLMTSFARTCCSFVIFRNRISYSLSSLVVIKIKKICL